VDPSTTVPRTGSGAASRSAATTTTTATTVGRGSATSAPPPAAGAGAGDTTSTTRLTRQPRTGGASTLLPGAGLLALGVLGLLLGRRPVARG
jgi:cobalamin biosynthesis Mg chelatase CobN